MTAKELGIRLGSVERDVAEVKTTCAVLNTNMEVIKKSQEETHEQVKLIDNKLDQVILNGVAKNGEAKLQGYKIGIWGWFIRVVTSAAVVAVIGYIIKAALK